MSLAASDWLEAFIEARLHGALRPDPQQLSLGLPRFCGTCGSRPTYRQRERCSECGKSNKRAYMMLYQRRARARIRELHTIGAFTKSVELPEDATT